MIRAAVITVSDSTSAGSRVDLSGPAVKQSLERLGWQVSAIFTTGGTGLAARDVTPEATRAILDREIPGIGEVMRAKGREATPLAVLSRAVAGTRGRVLIVNLPGSPKGAVESLDAIVNVVPHIVDLLEGRTGHHCPQPPERS